MTNLRKCYGNFTALIGKGWNFGKNNKFLRDLTGYMKFVFPPLFPPVGIGFHRDLPDAGGGGEVSSPGPQVLS